MADHFGSGGAVRHEGIRNPRVCLPPSHPHQKEHGTAYYSKSHIEEHRRPDLMEDDRYVTVEEAAGKYGLSKANLHHIVKVKGIGKVKVGVRNLLVREDVERVMAEREVAGL